MEVVVLDLLWGEGRLEEVEREQEREREPLAFLLWPLSLLCDVEMWRNCLQRKCHLLRVKPNLQLLDELQGLWGEEVLQRWIWDFWKWSFVLGCRRLIDICCRCWRFFLFSFLFRLIWRRFFFSASTVLSSVFSVVRSFSSVLLFQNLIQIPLHPKKPPRFLQEQLGLWEILLGQSENHSLLSYVINLG